MATVTEVEEEEYVAEKAGTWGGGESIAEQTEMWGDRASRALVSLNGKSTGNTGYENEQLKKQRLIDQRKKEAEISSLKFEKVSNGQSRASRRRKKRNNNAVDETQTKQITNYSSKTFQSKLEEFYLKHAPNKLDSIPTLLSKFAGNEDSLFEMLESKYLPPIASEEEKRKDGKSIALIKDKNPKKRNSKEESKQTKKNKLKNGDETEFATGEMEDLDALNAQNVNLFLSNVKNKPRKCGE